MKLSAKLNRVYVVAIGITIISSVLIFTASTIYYKQLARAEAEKELETLLAGEKDFLRQEFINRLYYGAQLRVKLTVLDHKGIEIGLYRATGEVIYETNDAPRIREALSRQGWQGTSSSRGYVVVGHNIEYAGQPLGFVFFALQPNSSTFQSFQSTFFGSLGMLITLISGFFFARRWLANLIEGPLNKVVEVIPKISLYVNGDIATLSVPGDLGSFEVNQVSQSLTKLADELKEARERQKEAEVIAERSLTIAQTAQSITHDMKKPFATLKSGLEAISNGRSVSDIQEHVRRLIPQVNKHTENLSQLLRELKEMGADSIITKEPISPTSLIRSAMQTISSESEVVTTYRLGHKYMVESDRSKVIRALHNIVYNALEATGSKGEIWFKTDQIRSNNQEWVQFCIGNSGSYIPEEELTKIFIPFYTRNKMDGTGLGLAIAYNIITSHQGRIYCTSSKDKGTEFWFTLPAIVGNPDAALNEQPIIP